MKSEYAIAKIHELERSGLHPTAEDVIRINAFGLAIDAAAGKNISESLDHLPRVAVLRKGVFLRQPTIGHDAWIGSVLRFVDATDLETLLAVNCFALSRQPKDLPDASDPESVTTAIDEFCKTFSDFTRDQLFVAYDWVKFGMSPGALEAKAVIKSDTKDSTDPKDPKFPSYDLATCVALGSLYRDSAILWGLSLDEIRGMTDDQLRHAVRIASKHQGVELDDGVREAEDEFEAVFYEIKTRLEKEKSDEKKE